MTDPVSRRTIPEPLGRRLALTPIGLDVIAALGHDPSGLRLTPLAHAIGSPVSSVQAALRILLANGLVTSDRGAPPQYALSSHPAGEALLEVALLLPEPAHVLAVVIRASAAVAFAVVDRDGFMVGLEPSSSDVARARIVRSAATITGARSDAPPVQIAQLDDLSRLAAVSVGSRARIASAIVLKGQIGLLARPARTRGAGRSADVPAT